MTKRKQKSFKIAGFINKLIDILKVVYYLILQNKDN